jgi:integrase/recombinase XerD
MALQLPGSILLFTFSASVAVYQEGCFMDEAGWQRYPRVAGSGHVRSWLTLQINLGLAPNTIAAYAHALEDFLGFCERTQTPLLTIASEHMAQYVGDLTARPRGPTHGDRTPTPGLSNATLKQRLTAVRLFFDYLVEKGIRLQNPVARGQYKPSNGFQGKRARGLILTYRTLPWIPTDEQWQAILEVVRQEPIRNRLMFALGYEAALRREELCALQTGDIQPGPQLVTIRAETTKNRQGRVVPYSDGTDALYPLYLQHRRQLSHARGPLFLSDSRRNRGEPISLWTWSKVVERVAHQAEVEQFTTHTLRHVRLTDLARVGWALHDIAAFAGHRSVESTLLYIHLSGRDLSEKLNRSERGTHGWLANRLGDLWK